MKKYSTTVMSRCIGTLLFAVTCSAYGSESGTVSAAPDGEPSAAPPMFSEARGVDAERLAILRGGSDAVINDQKLQGMVGSNTADNVFTGANTISAGAFSNVSGIPIVIQNSGANVLIQNATIINLQLQ